MSARMDRGLAPWSSKQFGARMEHVFLYAPNVAQKKKKRPPWKIRKPAKKSGNNSDIQENLY